MWLLLYKWVALLFIAISSWEVVTSVKIFSSSNKHQRLNPYSVANMYCNADGPIETCQFNIMRSDSTTVQLLIDSDDLTENWVTFNRYPDSVIAESYETNLTDGQCGISIRGLTDNHRYVVGCRIRVSGEPWIYRYSTLFVSVSKDHTADLLIVPDEDLFVSPGTPVSLSCFTSKGCRFIAANENNPNYGNGYDGYGGYGGYNEYGSGAVVPNCSFTRIVELDNIGMAWCADNSLTDSQGISVAAIRPPMQPPVLHLASSKPWHEVGELLEASCSVTESLPPANITWYIRDRIVGGDNLEELVDDRWRWSWEPENRTQIMRWMLTEQDDGKVLVCTVSHMALNKTLHSNAFVLQVVSVSTNVTTTTSSTTVRTTTPISTRVTIQTTPKPTTAATTKPAVKTTVVQPGTTTTKPTVKATTKQTTTTTHTVLVMEKVTLPGKDEEPTSQITSLITQIKDTALTASILKSEAASSTAHDKAVASEMTAIAVIEAVIIAGLLVLLVVLIIYLRRLRNYRCFAGVAHAGDEAWDLASVRDGEGVAM